MTDTTLPEDNDWVKYYCNVVKDINCQGYDVFVPYYESLMTELKHFNKYKETGIITITSIIPAPTKKMREAWIQRMLDKYESSRSDKDFESLSFVIKSYEDSIKEIMDSEIPFVQITDLNYSLKKLIEGVRRTVARRAASGNFEYIQI